MNMGLVLSSVQLLPLILGYISTNQLICTIRAVNWQWREACDIDNIWHKSDLIIRFHHPEYNSYVNTYSDKLSKIFRYPKLNSLTLVNTASENAAEFCW